MTINNLEIYLKKNILKEGVSRFAGEDIVYNITFNYSRYGASACRYDSLFIYGL